MIHDAAGLASYNHMYGSGFGSALTTAKQEALRTSVTSTLVANAAFGVDILEVGYRVRGGVSLARYLSAWDVCSRNALFLTGNGVSDSHEGTWIGNQCNFVTTALADDRTVNSLVGALAAWAAARSPIPIGSGGRSTCRWTGPARWVRCRCHHSTRASSRSAE